MGHCMSKDQILTAKQRTHTHSFPPALPPGFANLHPASFFANALLGRHFPSPSPALISAFAYPSPAVHLSFDHSHICIRRPPSTELEQWVCYRIGSSPRGLASSQRSPPRRDRRAWRRRCGAARECHRCDGTLIGIMGGEEGVKGIDEAGMRNSGVSPCLLPGLKWGCIRTDGVKQCWRLYWHVGIGRRQHSTVYFIHLHISCL